MSKYIFHFYVDNDRSLILWPGNEETRKKYDNPAYIDKLPISKELMKDLDSFGDVITAKFGYIKSLQKYPDLKQKKNDLISRLQKELGLEFEVIDKMA